MEHFYGRRGEHIGQDQVGVSATLFMRAAFLIQVSQRGSPLRTRPHYDVPKGIVSYLIREESWAVNRSQGGKLEVGMGKRSQEVSRNQAITGCISGLQNRCVQSAPWTQAKCL